MKRPEFDPQISTGYKEGNHEQDCDEEICTYLVPMTGTAGEVVVEQRQN